MNALVALRRITCRCTPAAGNHGGRLAGTGRAMMAGGLGEPLARNPVLVAMLFGLFCRQCAALSRRLASGAGFHQALFAARGSGAGRLSHHRRLADRSGRGTLAVAAAELVLVLVLLRWIAQRVFKLDAELACWWRGQRGLRCGGDPVGGGNDAAPGGACRHRHRADHIERYACAIAVSGGLSGRLAAGAGRALLRHFRRLQHLRTGPGLRRVVRRVRRCTEYGDPD